MTYLPNDLIWLVNKLIPRVVIVGNSGNFGNFDNFDNITKIELLSNLVIKPEGRAFSNLEEIVYNGYTISLEGNCDNLFFGCRKFNLPLDN